MLKLKFQVQQMLLPGIANSVGKINRLHRQG
jgi:hypothetical protein